MDYIGDCPSNSFSLRNQMPNWIIESARKVLEANKYTVSAVSEDYVQFEDETLIGFVCSLSLLEILKSWTARQDEFILHQASNLRKSPTKSWNLYSVFLSSDPVDELGRFSIASIEEDFRATRKIVQVGITTNADVIRALYPLIPIQNVIGVGVEDLKQKLRTRLSELPDAAVRALLDESKDERSLFREFREAYEVKTP
jgi:hypothetical protein